MVNAVIQYRPLNQDIQNNVTNAIFYRQKSMPNFYKSSHMLIYNKLFRLALYTGHNSHFYKIFAFHITKSIT